MFQVDFLIGGNADVVGLLEVHTTTHKKSRSVVVKVNSTLITDLLTAANLRSTRCLLWEVAVKINQGFICFSYWVSTDRPLIISDSHHGIPGSFRWCWGYFTSGGEISCDWFCAETHPQLRKHGGYAFQCSSYIEQMWSEHNVFVNAWMVPGANFQNWPAVSNGTSEHTFVVRPGPPWLPTNFVDCWLVNVFSQKAFVLFIPSNSAALRNAPAACSLVGLCRRGPHVI